MIIRRFNTIRSCLNKFERGSAYATERAKPRKSPALSSHPIEQVMNTRR